MARPKKPSILAPREPAKAPAPPKCRCNGDHSHQQYARTSQPIQQIIEASHTAATPLDYSQAFSAWIAALIPPARAIGVEGPNFMPKLEAKLEEMMRHEADLQSRANAVQPRDVQGGIFHGGLRGEIQEAQHQIKRARKGLGEMKKYEEDQARKRSERANAAPAIKPIKGSTAEMHRAYVEEAHKLEKQALAAAQAAERSGSKADWRKALSDLTEAVSMHQRAALSTTDAATFMRHDKAQKELNEVKRKLQRRLPTKP